MMIELVQKLRARIAELEKEVEQLRLRQHEETLRQLEPPAEAPGCQPAPPVPAGGRGPA